MEQEARNKSNKKRHWQPGIIVLLISAILIGLCALGVMVVLSGCAAQPPEVANHVFVFMGDGMGINHVAAARYLAQEEKEALSDHIWSSSSFDSFRNIGLMTTHNLDRNVTDSAASATAMFTGNKTFNEALNCNPETGETYTPLAKRLSDAGIAVGVVSTTTLEHASPAALYAVSEDRYDYTQIAEQGIACGWLDFWAAGGFVWDQEEMNQAAENAGFTVADKPDEIRALTGDSLPALVAAADDEAAPYMAYEIDRSRNAYYGEDTIAFGDLVRQAVSCFSEEERFFLFAESAKVDTASAALDLKTALCEVMALDGAVEAALKFYEEHPEDTLIVVLSDHETGGLRLRTDMDYGELTTQVASGVRFRAIMEELYDTQAPFSEAMEKAGHYFGIYEDDLDEEERAELEESYYESLTGDHSDDDPDPFTTALCELKAEWAQASFASSSHTAQPVAVYALGKGAENFTGLYDNTEIYQKLMTAMGLKAQP